MMIKFHSYALRRTRWYEYALRFFFGGAITVAAGLIAKFYGPVFGGLFLAFPAIFPASATLVQKHETEKERRAGIMDARGAALGCVALGCFGALLWRFLPDWNAGLALLAALAIWLVVALLGWRLLRLHYGS